MYILKLRFLFTSMMVIMCMGFSADVYAPKPFKTIMTNPLGKEWTPNSVSTIENRCCG